MIQIQDKHNCCGCSACVQICPKQCISFEEDKQGFRYPNANKQLCINCGLCEAVCPFLNRLTQKIPQKTYAAINPNEDIRLKSSSGGIFSMLAEATIKENGVVFGARFNDQWDVIHDYAETKNDLVKFRGSKYTQSFIGETYIQVKKFLKTERKVLFSGTGCQIAGLKCFLQKEYDNLLSVEIACHAVPSPLLWRKYREEQSKGFPLTNVNFRSKSTGWKNYSIILKTDNFFNEEKNGCPYIKGLISNLTTRPSCSQCPTRQGKSGADIIIGDCWGIWETLPEFDDDKGTSVVQILSQKGEFHFKEIKAKINSISLPLLYKYNKGLLPPSPEHPFHDKFFSELETCFSAKDLLIKYTRTTKLSLKKKISNTIKKMLK